MMKWKTKTSGTSIINKDQVGQLKDLITLVNKSPTLMVELYTNDGSHIIIKDTKNDNVLVDYSMLGF